MKKAKVGVAGANGYAGMTAVHLLARHPGVELCGLTSRSLEGKPYSEVFPLLELKVQFATELPDGLDAVFSCLPHDVGAGAAMAWLMDAARVIDISADLQLRDAPQFAVWYPLAHPALALLANALFGPPW